MSQCWCRVVLVRLQWPVRLIGLSQPAALASRSHLATVPQPASSILEPIMLGAHYLYAIPSLLGLSMDSIDAKNLDSYHRINLCRTRFIFINIKISSYVLSFVNMMVAQVIEILCSGRKWPVYLAYRKTSNISRTLVGDKIVDNSDVVVASPVGAAPTTSSFST